MSYGETINFDLRKPWLVSCEAHGHHFVSLWFIVWGAAGDGGQTRGWPAQHQAGDHWDQPRDPEAEIWDRPRQEAGMEGPIEQKSVISFLDHQVSSAIMWEISGHWGKSKKSSLRLETRSPTYKWEKNSGQTNSHWSVGQRHSLEALKWDSIRWMADLGIQDTCGQSKFQVRKCEEDCCKYAQIQYEKETEKRHRTNGG